MYSGRIVGIVGPDTSREALGLMMAGVPADEALAATADPSSATDASSAAEPVSPEPADDNSATPSAEETE